MDLQGESAFIDAFDKHMFALFTKGEDHKLDAATKRLLVNKRLRYIADLAQRTDGYHYRYYFVYQEPSEKEENLKQTIEQLRINYPQLFFISLTPSNALLIAERDLCWPLSDIYKSAKGTPGYGKTYDKAG